MQNYFTYLFLLFFELFYAQTHCESVELFLDDSGDNTFVFDNFSDYEGGFPRKTLARLKVRVKDKAVPDDLCSWNLTVRLDNAGNPSDELEEINLYGVGNGQNPQLNIFEIRAINDCMTSDDYSNFVPLSNVNDILEIIKPVIGTLQTSDVIPANSCVKNVNSAGDFLNNYSEFTFKIELRVKPGMSYNPGIFGLNFTFRLEENI